MPKGGKFSLFISFLESEKKRNKKNEENFISQKQNWNCKRTLSCPFYTSYFHAHFFAAIILFVSFF